MILVTIFGANILVKREYSFEKLEQAKEFLQEEKFCFDAEEEGVEYWNAGEETFALIEVG